MEGAKQGLELLSTVLDAAPIPEPFKSAVKGIPDIALQILTIVEAVKGNVEDAEALAVYIANVTKTTMRPFETKPPSSLDRSPAMKTRIEEFQGVLVEIKQEMENLTSRRLRDRVFSYSKDASKLAAMKKKVDDAINLIQLETAVATSHEVDLMSQAQQRNNEEHLLMFQRQGIQQQLIMNQLQLIMSQHPYMTIMNQQLNLLLTKTSTLEIENLINRLGPGDSGALKKPPCLAGTRESVLDRIARWIEGPADSSSHCFWLVGAAGTGKSSVAASVARREKKSRRLGAGFYFTRDEQERNRRAMMVVARQLANWGDRRLRAEIASAIREEPDMTQMTPEEQFQNLIQTPLETLESTSSVLIIILDALDECDDQYATLLLRLVGKGLARLPAQVKIFITSRGEPHLQQFYTSEPMRSHVEIHSLGEEKRELVDKDINAYFRERLPELVGKWVANASEWPGEERLRVLVLLAQGLFIWATTVGGILGDVNFRDPEKQLESILSMDRKTHLDDIYAKVLERACPATVDNGVLVLFQNVLGALLVVQAPVNIYTLASLLSSAAGDYQAFAERIRATVLIYLQAVLVVPGVEISGPTPDAQPIRFIHTSFVDYLTDSTRCSYRFVVDLPKHHKRLAIGCLERMRELKRNMCNLDPSLLNSEVSDLAERIRGNMSPGLQYACVHMAMHVSQVPAASVNVHDLLGEFARERMIYWLEGLSLMGKAPDAVGMTAMIEAWLKLNHPSPTILSSRPPSSTLVGDPDPRHTDAEPKAMRKRDRLRRMFSASSPKAKANPSPPSATVPTEIEDVTATLLYDVRRFVMEFMEPITASSLHVYSSALPFAPSETMVSRFYSHLMNGSLR
ncbi:hypothetical protein FRB97_007128, partial [Tulasnella sp. 331]